MHVALKGGEWVW